MHLQIRSIPTLSPPDVEKFLKRLADANVNLLGAGGSNVEFGGEFAVALGDEGDERTRAAEALDRDPKYTYRILEVGVDPGLTLWWLKNEVGALHKCIEKVAAENRGSGRKIHDLLIGVQEKRGIPVQVYSE
jgi:hypothetical protein